MSLGAKIVFLTLPARQLRCRQILCRASGLKLMMSQHAVDVTGRWHSFQKRIYSGPDWAPKYFKIHKDLGHYVKYMSADSLLGFEMDLFMQSGVLQSSYTVQVQETHTFAF